MLPAPQVHRQAVAEFGARVRQVRAEQWNLPTPCTDWDVRALVNHIVSEELWTPPLMAGKRIEDVGDRFEGDVLGANPLTAWTAASAEAVAAMESPGAMERTVHLSFGDVPGQAYALQLFADHLVHAWDLARATGADERLDPALVDACAEWFTDWEQGYRDAGAIGPRVQSATGGDPQAELLARFGRMP